MRVSNLTHVTAGQYPVAFVQNVRSPDGHTGVQFMLKDDNAWCDDGTKIVTFYPSMYQPATLEVGMDDAVIRAPVWLEGGQSEPNFPYFDTKHNGNKADVPLGEGEYKMAFCNESANGFHFIMKDDYREFIWNPGDTDLTLTITGEGVLRRAELLATNVPMKFAGADDIVGDMAVAALAGIVG